MFTKNMFLFSVSLLAFTIAADNKLKGEFTNTNNKNIADLAKMDDQLIAFIKTDDAKDFAAGFGLGIAHGLINRTTTNLMASDFSKNTFCFGTFVATNLLDAEYNKHYYPKSGIRAASTWGHAFGQIVGDSIDLNDPLAKPKLSVNLTLVCVTLYSLLKDIKIK